MTILISMNIYSQNTYGGIKSRLLAEAQAQLKQGIAPNDVVLNNKTQTMDESDIIIEIKKELKKMENARALKIKEINDAKQDSIAEATNPTLREIRQVARAKLAEEARLIEEDKKKNADEYYYDGFTPLDTLIGRQLKLGILPCDVKITSYADFNSTKGDASAYNETVMIDKKLTALCRGLKVDQDVPKYMFELEDYQVELLKAHTSGEQDLEQELDFDNKDKDRNQRDIEIVKELDSLYKLRPTILAKAVNLRSRFKRYFNEKPKLDIPFVMSEIEKEVKISDIKRRYNLKQLSYEDYQGISNLDWNEEKYFNQKRMNVVKDIVLTSFSLTSLPKNCCMVYSESKELYKLKKYICYWEDKEGNTSLIFYLNNKKIVLKRIDPGDDEKEDVYCYSDEKYFVKISKRKTLFQNDIILIKESAEFLIKNLITGREIVKKIYGEGGC